MKPLPLSDEKKPLRHDVCVGYSFGGVMNLTAPGWTVRDHIFGKRKPPSRLDAVVGLGMAYAFGVVMVIVMFVAFVAAVKFVWGLV